MISKRFTSSVLTSKVLNKMQKFKYFKVGPVLILFESKTVYRLSETKVLNRLETEREKSHRKERNERTSMKKKIMKFLW